jgi:hypothetical protein
MPQLDVVVYGVRDFMALARDPHELQYVTMEPIRTMENNTNTAFLSRHDPTEFAIPFGEPLPCHSPFYLHRWYLSPPLMRSDPFSDDG